MAEPGVDRSSDAAAADGQSHGEPADTEAVRSRLGAAKTDPSILLRPLLHPRGDLYRWTGVIERVERGIEGEIYILAFAGQPDMRFAAIVNRHTEWVGKERLRMSEFATVAGPYRENLEYTTVLGAQLVMPAVVALRFEVGLK